MKKIIAALAAALVAVFSCGAAFADAEWDAFVAEIAKSAFALKCTATAQGAAGRIAAKLPELLKEKFARDAAKGMTRPPRLMVAGIPNTGKSTVINALSGAKRAVTGEKIGTIVKED